MTFQSNREIFDNEGAHCSQLATKVRNINFNHLQIDWRKPHFQKKADKQKISMKMKAKVDCLLRERKKIYISLGFRPSKKDTERNKSKFSRLDARF